MGLFWQNERRQRFELESDKSYLSLGDIKPLPPIGSEGDFDFNNFQAEASHAQPKPFTPNESTPTFTFSWSMQSVPKTNVPDVPFLNSCSQNSHYIYFTSLGPTERPRERATDRRGTKVLVIQCKDQNSTNSIPPEILFD
jgi:hypothetical protein